MVQWTAIWEWLLHKMSNKRKQNENTLVSRGFFEISICRIWSLLKIEHIGQPAKWAELTTSNRSGFRTCFYTRWRKLPIRITNDAAYYKHICVTCSYLLSLLPERLHKFPFFVANSVCVHNHSRVRHVHCFWSYLIEEGAYVAMGVQNITTS